jgi:hypothetical protein
VVSIERSLHAVAVASLKMVDMVVAVASLVDVTAVVTTSTTVHM